ncbi:MAG TPA: TonB-dependent receptor plug domain-containing protein, partial [Pirellulales bacterium]|nr:TonB-dependent receptor plug domain-containing protein [Pirellulales bacterium]
MDRARQIRRGCVTVSAAVALVLGSRSVRGQQAEPPPHRADVPSAVGAVSVEADFPAVRNVGRPSARGPSPAAPPSPSVKAARAANRSRAASAWDEMVSDLPTEKSSAAGQDSRPRSASAGRRSKIPTTFRPEGYYRTEAGNFRLVQDVEPQQPLPSAPTLPVTSPDEPVQPLPSLATLGFGGIVSSLEQLTQERREIFQSTQTVASATSARALTVNAQPDLAEAISKDVLSVQTQWRSSISENPYIRGFKNRQVYAQLDGQFYEPVRSDLDTIVSKIDPGIVQDVIVIEGPYSVRYGPGFTFMDIVTRPTPRNQPAQYRTSTSWLPNGQQIYGRETVSGGSGNLGYRFSYGHRNGNDYRAGNNVYIPSHYNNGDMLAELGYSLSSSQRLEFNYRRLDQNHTAYPGQFFDVSSLQTNAFNLRYIDEDPTKPWTRLIAQGWFNQNSMTGNTFNSTKQPTVNAVQRALTQFYYPSTVSQFGGNPTTNTNIPLLTGFAGSTTGNIMSTGGRLT